MHDANDHGTPLRAPSAQISSTDATRGKPARPEGGSRFDAVLTHWAVRLVVVLSMLAALVVGIVGSAPTAVAAVGDLWTQLAPTTSPTARSGAAIAYDASTNQTILFGGNANGTAENDTWSWNGTNWTELSPPTSPSARYNASLAYDPATQQLILFGGFNGSAYLNDTWSWTGTTWTQLSPTTVPPVRDGAALAYDGASGQANLVLFGGYNGTTYLQDTWTWSGSNWTSPSPTTKPAVREEASFGYDSSTSQMILFGGYSGSDLSDTWSWSGTNWTSLSPTASPSARFGAGVGYNPAIGDLALFGGLGASFDADTWVWTGTNWSQLSSSTSPSARMLPAMTFDTATSQMVLFGGYNGTSYLADTWQWSAVAVTGVSPIAGPPAGGTSVTITGIGFNGVTAVNFGSTAETSSNYTVNSSTQITATAPAQSAGTVNITVATPGGTSAVSSADIFSYGATISGVVADTNNPGGVSGVCVYATSSDGNSGRAVTGTNGTYAITDLAADSYTVKFDATCSETVTSLDETQWYNDASSQSDATLVTVVSGQTASGIDATLVTTAAVLSESVSASVPDAPSKVTAVVANASATVTWASPADNGSAIISYKVTATDLTSSQRGGETCTVKSPGPTSCEVTGLTNGDRYTFVVTATNGVGIGPSSVASSPVVPIAVPGAPLHVVAVRGNNSAMVSWAAPTSDGGSAITGYTVTASGSRQSCRTKSATSCPVTGLVNGTVYTFTVTATNSLGTGPASSASSPVVPAKWSKIALKLSAKRVTYGREQVERLSVKVAPRWVGPTPTGTVKVTELGKTLCVITLSSGRGACLLSAKELAIGSYQLAAAYSGSRLYLPSGSVRTLTVVEGVATKIALKLSAATVSYGLEHGESVSITVSSRHSGPKPTGTVTITELSRVLCTITLSSGHGSCRLSARQLAVGTHHLAVHYLGNSPYLPSGYVAEVTVVA